MKDTKGTLEENLTLNADQLITEYHDEQYKLFNELSKRFPGTSFLTNTNQGKDKKGRWILYRNGKALTTIKFFNFVDKITLKYIEELKVLDVKSLTPSGIEVKESDIKFIADSCETIVMARYLGNITYDTDFKKDEETKLWRSHVAVILSFAALLVILQMFQLKLRPNSTKNRATNQSKSRKKIKYQNDSPSIRKIFLEVCFCCVVIVYWFCSARAFVEKLLKSP